MNNAGKWILIALTLAAAPVLHAQEDEDDPKGAPHRPATIAPKPRAKAAEAKPEPKTAEPKTAEPKIAEPKSFEPPVKRTADVRPAKPAAPEPKAALEKAPDAKPAPIAKPTAQKGAAPESDAPAIAARKPLARTAAEPAVKIATVGATVDGPSPARTVRVRLLDGSSVVGLVHAEESEVLVVDCALGQLAIPRGRISTIAYDAAAGAGSKHAPVQQLDDDDRLPPRKRAAPAAPTP
jgi:hypothetical protein